jgi:DNA polymerase-3 subunit delta'
MIDAVVSGRPHHGWLLTGPPGIGKASFAEAAAIWLLAGCPEGRGFGGAAGSQAANLVREDSHPDFRRLVRTTDDKGKLRTVIRVDEVRAMQAVLAQTPSLGAWRVVIVDSADEMNLSAANSLLKHLEEPPSQTIFMLISHAPGRLLPTIRSRCRVLRMKPLADAEVARVLDDIVDGLDDADRDALVRMAGGIPGRALAMAEPGVAALETSMMQLARLPAAESEAAALALARSLAGKTAAGRYTAFLARAPNLIAEAARTQSGARLARTIDDWHAASTLAATAGPLTLDPLTVVHDIARRIARLGT